MFYRCSECKKPFITPKIKNIKGGYVTVYAIQVSPCCNSLGFHSESNTEFVLEWAKDFVEMNEKAE